MSLKIKVRENRRGNQETQPTSGTQDKNRGQTKPKTQHRKLKRLGTHNLG